MSKTYRSPDVTSWAEKCENWHTATMARYKKLSVAQLEFIRADAYEAAQVGDGWNEKAGQYWDEVHYASMELKARNVV